MRDIRRLLGTQGVLKQLQNQLARQQALTEQVRSMLPAPLNEHLSAAVLIDEKLSLLVASPVWASRLRFLAPQLMRQLRQQGLALSQIQPRIIPENPLARRQRSLQPARKPSPGSAEALRQAADAMEPGPLQEALRRLSRHHK